MTCGCTKPGEWITGRADQELISWTITGVPSDATIDISFDGNPPVPGTWDGSTLSVLIAGPDVSGPSGTLLVLGAHKVQAIITDTPELLTRDLGTIEIR